MSTIDCQRIAAVKVREAMGHPLRDDKWRTPTRLVQQFEQAWKVLLLPIAGVRRIGCWSGTLHARHGFAVNYGASVPPEAAIGLERPSADVRRALQTEFLSPLLDP